MDDSFLGTAVLLNSESISGYNLDDIIHADKSLNNINIYSKLTNNSFSYWAGFGWKKQGNFIDENSWSKHLQETSLKINSPLKILITKNKQ